MEFAYDGGGLAKGGSVSLFIDGDKVGEGRVPATIPMIFSADETTDVGYESASPVSEDYNAETSKFNGSVLWVQIDLGTDDADHLISPMRGCGWPWRGSEIGWKAERTLNPGISNRWRC